MSPSSSILALFLLSVLIALAQCQWGGGWNQGGFGGGYGGGFGAQQAWNVQNAARIGTEVAEGVLVAEEVQEAIGK